MRLRLTLRLAEIILAAALAATLLISWRDGRRDRAQLAAQLAAAQQSLAAAASRQHDRDSQLAQALAAISAEKRAANSASPRQLLAALQQQLGLPAAPFLQSPIAAPSAAPTPKGARPSPVRPLTFAVHPADGKGSAGPQDSLSSPPATPPASSPPANASADSAVCSGRSLDPPAALPPCADPQPPAIFPSPQNPPPQTGSGTQIILPEQDLKPLYDFALDCKACQARLAAAQADLADEKTKSAALTRERDAALKAADGGGLLRRVARAAKWFAIGAAAGALFAKVAH
jgi:hypothetical protein